MITHTSDSHQGAISIRKMVLPGMVIPMLKIRCPNGRLIFNMEIAIHKTVFILRRGPDSKSKEDKVKNFFSLIAKNSNFASNFTRDTPSPSVSW